MNYYDKDGGAFVYLYDDRIVYQYDGTPVATVQDEAVYDLEGRHIGWSFDGWMTDLSGGAVLFCRPSRMARFSKPGMRPDPIRRERQPAPADVARTPSSAKPQDIPAWSSLSVGDFFQRPMELEKLPKWQFFEIQEVMRGKTDNRPIVPKVSGV